MKHKMMKADAIERSPYNPRIDLTPNDAAFKKLASSIREFGCVEPIVVNEYNNRCVGGHQRLEVMRYLGYEEIPCVFINEPDEMREKALNIALNKIDNKFDESKLSELLEDLDNLDIDTTITGFSEKEIEDLLASIDYEDVEFEEPEEEQEEEADVWCKIGIYNFPINREVYVNKINEIKILVGLDDDSVTEELKRRLMNRD